jgi:flagellar basal body-associated protein FliL
MSFYDNIQGMKIEKRIIFLISIVLIVLISIAIFFYFSFNFSGKVLKKYQTTSAIQGINIQSNHLYIQYWLGEKDFVINNENDFKGIEIGNSYSFTKKFGVDWLELR